jgi:hypothetical protein
MWLEKLLKKQFISFYKEESYKCISQIVKNKNILQTEEKSFEDKKEFVKYIRQKIDEIPQTYVSTMLLTINQGVVPSCSVKAYLDREIDPDNVKIACINNKYSFFASIYEIQNIKKEYKFDIDFIYSVFAIIDSIAKERKNRFYVLVLEKHIAILGYENFVPIFSDINVLEEKQEEDVEEIVEDIDLEEELISDIDSIDEVEETDTEEEIEKETTSKEVEILNYLKSSLKEYYDNYSSDFIEKIIILDTIGIDITLNSLIEEELLITSDIQQIDILNTMNRLSIESV